MNLLGADGVELNHYDNDRVEGRNEHEDEVENDEKLKMQICLNNLEFEYFLPNLNIG